MKEVNVVKKLVVLILTLVMLASLSAACGSAGPAGAPGSAGPAGPAGPAGAAGEPGSPASTARIVVTPASGKAATTITISGAGFIPGEKVDLLLEIAGVENLLGTRGLDEGTTLVANEYGAFTAISRIPRVNPPAGTYAMEAVGDKGTIAFFPLQVTE